MKGSDEKQLHTEVPSQGDPVGLNDPQLEWAETEEKAILRKSNALTDFFLKDVGIQQNEFNIGQQLFAAGVLVLQAFQHGLGAFLATRLILGITEAGFVPASLFTIGRWYKKDETTKRFAWFFTGSGIASGCSGLLAYGVLHMRDIAGLRGWQWLFILEGTLTVLVGIAFLFLFPKSTSNPVSILGTRFFNEREARILTERVLRDDPAKAQPRLYVSSAELKSAMLSILLGFLSTQGLLAREQFKWHSL
ncbi:putative transporter YIL166C [Colletotrichum liriopes]|uniref:Transporter YIL166C n=1 Tax=Colletotrichum liriopes TaxID=708192 RepID=A0AA37LW71_9PEZI|nr:putative transporter YIL166C [Colletotrichum liriopes]